MLLNKDQHPLSAFQPMDLFDPFRIGRKDVTDRSVSPDCIRFTDFMPGLIKFDPFRVMNKRTEWPNGIGFDGAGRIVEAHGRASE